MTERYNPYQNAIAEWLNSILKQEFLMNTDKVDINMMKKIVAQSIKTYNIKSHIYPVTCKHQSKCINSMKSDQDNIKEKHCRVVTLQCLNYF